MNLTETKTKQLEKLFDENAMNGVLILEIHSIPYQANQMILTKPTFLRLTPEIAEILKDEQQGSKITPLTQTKCKQRIDIRTIKK